MSERTVRLTDMEFYYLTGLMMYELEREEPPHRLPKSILAKLRAAEDAECPACMQPDNPFKSHRGCHKDRPSGESAVCPACKHFKHAHSNTGCAVDNCGCQLDPRESSASRAPGGERCQFGDELCGSEAIGPHGYCEKHLSYMTIGDEPQRCVRTGTDKCWKTGLEIKNCPAYRCRTDGSCEWRRPEWAGVRRAVDECVGLQPSPRAWKGPGYDNTELLRALVKAAGEAAVSECGCGKCDYCVEIAGGGDDV